MNGQIPKTSHMFLLAEISFLKWWCHSYFTPTCLLLRDIVELVIRCIEE